MTISRMFLALVTLFTLALLIPTGGRAQDPPPGQNILGLYSAQNFDGPVFSYVEDVDEFTSVSGHMVLSGLSVTAIGGFECMLTFAGTSVIVGTTYPVPAINTDLNVNESTVGYDVPLVVTESGTAHIASVTILFR